MQLTDDLCLVQTVDFFTPIVDSPYHFGRVAAANALSDIYAMGAKPLTAMNIVGWPSKLGMAHLADILRGGAEKIAEAGAELAGGHSIDDREPKYGLSVTGVAHPGQIVYNSGGRAGDILILTKRLGIGVLASGLKKGVLTEDDMSVAIDEAATLNASAATAMATVETHACTDVSGFGLAGHLCEMLDGAGLAATLWLDSIPIHVDVLSLLTQGVYAGGLVANRDFLWPRVQVTDKCVPPDDPRIQLLFDPQTSGGLLIAVAPEDHAALVTALETRGTPAWTIGRLTAERAGSLLLADRRDRQDLLDAAPSVRSI